MKFGREFTSQMVQEWQEAYMDYNYLKTLLKDVLRFQQNNASSTEAISRTAPLQRRLSMYRAFSGLTSRYNSLKGSPRKNSPRKNEDEVILVSAVQEGSENSYQTMFLRSSEKGGEHELFFFRRLDDEFNKVVKFYKGKVEEVKMEADELSKQMDALKVVKFYKGKVEEVKMEAEELSKQMDALIALQIRVDKPSLAQKYAQESKSSSSDGSDLSPATIIATANGIKQDGSRMDAILELEMGKFGDEKKPDNEVNKEANGFRPPPLEVLDHVKINVEPDTPVSTLRNVIMSSTSDLAFSKAELRKAEEKLRQAFIEFYRKLRYLKSYCFEQITSRKASKAYLEMVDKSYLGSSDEVSRLIEKLEATFIKLFSNGNRRRGMAYLKPQVKKERHRITFFLGLFTGCSIALVVAIIVSISGRDLLHHQRRGQYMETIFPLYRGNTYFWRRFRANYPFIFGFKQGTELEYREVFLLASGLSVLALAAVLSNLDMEMDPGTKSFKTLTELVLLFIVFCPFNIIYRSSHFFLVQCVWHCLCAPFYKVTLHDFFLADQITSQVQAI